jgi:hypothetical protein
MSNILMLTGAMFMLEIYDRVLLPQRAHYRPVVPAAGLRRRSACST